MPIVGTSLFVYVILRPPALLVQATLSRCGVAYGPCVFPAPAFQYCPGCFAGVFLPEQMSALEALPLGNESICRVDPRVCLQFFPRQSPRRPEQGMAVGRELFSASAGFF